ncbi:MAG TPA: HEAT repeat domain-containing protein [Aggregatilinea sp.]|jgi:hypothetical protein|uniref:HEAT repeat domain-containing protein n=1 Tax=Aggregatilinea sp. TaxID=2806333 RepID=UPI002BD169C3|nr:HEAT repeat domain-containing protein [Aggregatilinea sp.]HML20183.1 HEAT repeat domain-containing protein [Aggregatilinea sp.]
MSASEKLIAYHMLRLSDKNPSIRIQSIEELALLEATEAYSALETLFRTDPDETVRRTAQKAGRVLYLKLREKGENPAE